MSERYSWNESKNQIFPIDSYVDNFLDLPYFNEESENNGHFDHEIGIVVEHVQNDNDGLENIEEH